MAYATPALFKAAVEIADTVDDTDIQRALDAATEWIDNYCGRVFGPLTASEARLFDVGETGRLHVPDLATVTEVAIDTARTLSYSTVITASQYQLYPLDKGQPGVRGGYNEIRLRPNVTSWSFTQGQVRVTGTWGYGSIPAAVEEACILLANRYFRRPSVAFGVQESAQTGELARIIGSDPDVVRLLEGFRAGNQVWVAV